MIIGGGLSEMLKQHVVVLSYLGMSQFAFDVYLLT